MLKIPISLTIIFSVFLLIHKDQSLPANDLFSISVRQQLKLPEEEIDAGIAALTFAKEIYPEINVHDYSNKIDALVMNAKRLTDQQPLQDADSKIRALNTYFYRIAGFHYDKSSNMKTDQRNFFLNGILDTKQGNCVTLPMLYMAIAQRLGYPIYPVTAPEHFFLRFNGPELTLKNIEATSGGGYESDERYMFNLNISKKSVENGAYLRTLTNREFLGMLLQQNAIVFLKRHELDRAIAYFEKAVEIDPRMPGYYENLRLEYILKGRTAQTKAQVIRYRKKEIENFIKAEHLGFVRDPDANTRRPK